MRTQNQPRSNGICGIEVEILKEADLAGISNVSCSPVVAGGNKVRPSVQWKEEKGIALAVYGFREMCFLPF